MFARSLLLPSLLLYVLIHVLTVNGETGSKAAQQQGAADGSMIAVVPNLEDQPMNDGTDMSEENEGELDEEKRAMPGVMRFGKRGDMPGVLRFGKRAMPGVMRFGKRAMPGVMRFGKKAMPGVMRFGKRSEEGDDQDDINMDKN